MIVTATNEARRLLTADPDGVAKLCADYEVKKESRDSKVKQSAADIRKKICQAEFALVESASLRWEKFVHVGDDSKKDEVDSLVNSFKPQPVPSLLPPGAASFTAKLGGRMLVNQAGGILENAGLCLHPHYNCPMIPGSAVKGIARHAAWQEWFDADDAGARRDTGMRLAFVFGYPTGDSDLDDYLASPACLPTVMATFDRKQTHWAGAVSFLAASATGAVHLVADIVTCHHRKYYQAANASVKALDNEEPVPVFFPAVAEGAAFRFTLVQVRRGMAPGSLFASQAPLDYAKDWLVKALTLNGAGAKTAAGYGWFLFDPEAERRRLAAEAAEAAAKAEAEARRLSEERRAKAKAEERAKLAAMTPDQKADYVVSQWDEATFRRKCENFIKEHRKGGPADDAERSAIVRFLRSDHLSVWNDLKLRGTKGELGNAVNAIRAHSRKIGQEKMP